MHRVGRPPILAAVLVMASLMLIVLPGWDRSQGGLDGAVTLRLERTTFAVGDDVPFTEHNGRRETIYLPCADPWAVHRSIAGEWYRVERHECDATIRPMGPGDVYAGVWHSGVAPPPGYASVEAGYYRIDMVAFSCPDGLDRCQRIMTVAFFWLR